MKYIALFLVIVFANPVATAQIPYQHTAQIKPRLSHEIAASPWGIGGETMDLDYTIFKTGRNILPSQEQKK